jgi:hypothetical protein
MSNRALFIAAILLLAVGAATLAQKPAESTDGEAHGDPPYLIESGWTPLLNGSDLTGWHAQNGKPLEWITTRAVRWERYGPTRLFGEPSPSGSMMNSLQGKTSNIVTDQKFGSVELYIEFMVAKGSNSGVYLQGLYEVQVFDSYGAWEKLTSADCGGIYKRWINDRGVGGSAPKVNASRRPGEWQSFHIWFRAPIFDASGRKMENARFLRVLHNGLPVQEDVAVEGPTRSHMPIAEAPLNPIMLQGDHGPVAYRNIYIRPLRPIVYH